MGAKAWEDLWWVSYVVLAVWLVNGILIIYLQSQIDSIVNVQLYDYGLQFSKQWADAYWTSARLMLVFLGLPMALSAAVFVAGFRRFRKKATSILSKKKKEQTQVEPSQMEVQVAPVEENPSPEKLPVALEEHELNPQVESRFEPEQETEPVCEPQLEVIQPDVIQLEQSNLTVEVTKITDEPKAKVEIEKESPCPSCCRVFDRPIIKLDFNNGTTRLVNVCPFCGHILGEDSDSSSKEEDKE